ncbi:MAG: DUF5615 family PIN-like protein [Tepidisphaeraceae bacterium]
MKLLLDEGLPPLSADLLRADGIDATHVRDCGLAAAADPIIIEYARNGGFTIVTYDSDFHRHLASDRATEPSTIRIRIEGLRGAEVASLLRKVIEAVGVELDAGVCVTVDERRIRFHRLPLK